MKISEENYVKMTFVSTIITLVCSLINLSNILYLESKLKEIREYYNYEEGIECNVNDSISIEKKEIENQDKFITHVTLTTYNPCKEQCNEDFLHTADNSFIDLEKLKKGKIKWCAISRNLLFAIPLGSIIEIEGHGIYEVKDTMNARYAHCIDILQDESQPNFKKHKVKVTLIKKA
jgi:3D (Asp-Asp-Asp) domain-containing protein